jgi:hypothetical protein
VKNVWVITALVLGMLAMGAASAGAGSARGDDDVRRAGNCTGQSTSKIKLSNEDGRLEVEFEVDQNRNGQRWRVVMTDNGATVFRGVRVTRGPSGSFEARRVIRNRAGTDRVAATARNLRTGERCRAAARM